MKCKETWGWLWRKASTNLVLCAERLSAMTWIVRPAGWVATISCRKATNSALVWRAAVRPRDGSALGFQGGIERKGAVAKIFKAVGCGAPGRKRQNGIESIKRLDRAFFIHAENRGMGWRMQIQTNDIGRFGFEVRVGAHHVLAQAMRLEAVAVPDSSHPHVGGFELSGEASATPVSAAVVGFTPGPSQDASFQLGDSWARAASRMPRDQATETLRAKAPRPALHIGRAASQITSRPPHASPAGQFQNDARSFGILRAHPARARPAGEFLAFRWSKNQTFDCHPED